MSRQVRLDDDVCALVEAYQAAEGLPSLSSSANQILRLATAPDDPTPAEIEEATKVAAAQVVIAPRSRRRRRELPGPRPDGRTLRPPTPPERPPPAPAACPHPVLRRRGDRCGVCGDTILSDARTRGHP